MAGVPRLRAIAERDLIRERTLAGLEAADTAAAAGGRPAKMTSAKLRQAEPMHADGASVTEIADVLAIGRATVYRHLVGADLAGADVTAG